MKKAKRFFLIAMVGCLCLLSLAGEGVKELPVVRQVSEMFDTSEPVLQATTKFMYSVGAGTIWYETINEISVGETYYLAIEMQISQSKKTKDEKTVVATITIPNTTILDCYLSDYPGAGITGKKDAVSNSISYKFNIVAGTSPSKYRVVFECKPLKKGRATVSVVYDDSVNASWDRTDTIKYVEKKEEGAE